MRRTSWWFAWLFGLILIAPACAWAQATVVIERLADLTDVLPPFTGGQFFTWDSGLGVAKTAQPQFSAIGGSVACSQEPARTGDVTSPAGSCANTLATSGVTAATYGSATQTPQIVFDAKGRATSAANVTIAPPFSALTGSLACSQEPAHTGDVTMAAGGCVNVLVNIPNAVPVAGSLLFTESVAPGTPASGKGSVWQDSTDHRFHDKNPSGVIGTTVVAKTAATHKFFNVLSAAGVLTDMQPDFTDLTGSASCAQLPALTGPVTSSGCATTLTGPYAPTTYTAHGVLLGEGTGSVVATAEGPTGAYLRGVSGADPIWSTLVLPNAVTAGSVVFGSATNAYGQNNAKFFWDDVNGRLGLGTATPAVKLAIIDASATAYSGTGFAAGVRVSMQNTNATDGNFTAVVFAATDAGATAVNTGAISSVVTSHTAGAVNADLAFQVKIAGANTEAMRLNAGMQVGAPTGGFPGTGKINAASGYQVNGVALAQTMGTSIEGAQIATAATVYASPTYSATGATAFSATEANRQTLMTRSGTMTKLYFTLSSAQSALGSLVITVRKNGAATAITKTVVNADGTGTFSDIAHTFTFVAGDKISVEFANAAAAPGAAINSISVEYTI